MSVKAFLDTNILVYSRDAGAGEKQKQAEELIRNLWESRTGAVSIQILNEYFVTVTRKLKPGLSPERAWKDISLLKAWQPVSMDWTLLERSNQIFREHSLSWWDAQVVAAAQLANCSLLYTEDLNDGERFGNVVITNPFNQRVQ
jgi:predicted nucleic acid-binding protein